MRAVLAVALVLSLAGGGWLLVDNQRLRAQLAGARKQAPAAEAAAARTASDAGARPAATAAAGAQRLLGALGRFRSAPKGGEGDAPQAEETMAERRARRQARIEAMFGRADDETEEEYRARMVPFVEGMLDPQRERVLEQRKAAYAAAGVSDDQAKELDKIYSDAYAEAVALTNQAIATGELTPYRRNPSGVLSWVGGVGAVLSTAEGRVGGVLSPQQQQAMQDTGFDLAEYLGVTAPWETLNPPPPPPGTN